MSETSDSELTFKEDIQNRIHTIRGVQVMLDRDLAELYEVKSVRLRGQVKRNITRFPSDDNDCRFTTD
ncbi:MAG: ORF6N domain-containing protein [Candidatus Thermoplasmatota archaeon]|nr:ORF6N domain-containing protein [Euryarchaeota archaeon]MBU4071986.1 ORF6N domain-containing protein [Candidatus Thermoplasmatota archaeon]MBU4145254.1 ORF6N domain-containing protein [Candidatus Thermoplasmatota archaeon]MBU4591221.1 ORF6N domain-containing protein [Candidatus Thermoplasmatota archaeon]